MILSKLKAIYATLTIAIGLAFIIIFIFFTKRRDNARKARMACGLFFPMNNFEVEIRGAFDEEAQLIMLNHQSVADIMFLEGFHPKNICWIAKKQLGELPFYGYALRGPEMILIDREDKKTLIYLLKEAGEKLKQGRVLVIFPEGTRGKGDKMLKFKSGAKLLAEKYGLKIQPIVLINSRNIYNTSPLSSTSNTSKVIALKSFTPQKGSDWYERLEEEMNEVYAKNKMD